MNSFKELKKIERIAAAHYGLKTTSFPRQNDDLAGFENALFDLVRRIKFRKQTKYCSSIVKKINGFTRRVNKHTDFIVPADKTKNYYKLDYTSYRNLIYRELHKSYKIAPPNKIIDINLEAKKLLKYMNLTNHAEIVTPATPRFSLKDHKTNFQQNPSIRLICPSKSDLGIISKKILDRVIPTIRNKIFFSLWQSSDSVIEWFMNLKDKHRLSFITFDIDNYYQSITPILLNKALNLAKNNSDLTDQEIKLITLARRSILQFEGKLWTRKDTPNDFDITMGASDSAQVTDLVGLFLLNEMKHRFKNLRGGLYRDDALFVSDERPRRYSKTIEELHDFFRNFGLSITVDPERKTSNFLDITLNLNDGSYSPFHKPNLTLFYVHKLSNHPKAIINSIVPSVSNRISKLSANKNIFNQNAQFYNNALLNSGYSKKITYNQNKENDRTVNIITHNMTTSNRSRTKRNVNKQRPLRHSIIPDENHQHIDSPTPTARKRLRRKNNIWFNPPFNNNVKTNIPKEFFKILENSFKYPHKYSSILNKNSIKISYSTMPNIAQTIISANSKKIKNIQSNSNYSNPINTCNCRRTSDCPLDNRCTYSDIVYACTVTEQNNSIMNPRDHINTAPNQIPQLSTTTNLHHNSRPNNSNIHPLPQQTGNEFPMEGNDNNNIQSINQPNPHHINTVNRNRPVNRNINGAGIRVNPRVHTYIGATANLIKSRISMHNYSFNNDVGNNKTSLTTLVKNLRSNNIPHNIKWSILKKSNSYSPGSRSCGLCNSEAVMIATAPKHLNLINSRSELVSKCRHRRKFKYAIWKPPPVLP